jgi:hypothetical protein
LSVPNIRFKEFTSEFLREVVSKVQNLPRKKVDRIPAIFCRTGHDSSKALDSGNWGRFRKQIQVALNKWEGYRGFGTCVFNTKYQDAQARTNSRGIGGHNQGARERELGEKLRHN